MSGWSRVASSLLRYCGVSVLPVLRTLASQVPTVCQMFPQFRTLPVSFKAFRRGANNLFTRLLVSFLCARRGSEALVRARKRIEIPCQLVDLQCVAFGPQTAGVWGLNGVRLGGSCSAFGAKTENDTQHRSHCFTSFAALETATVGSQRVGEECRMVAAEGAP